MAAWIRVNAVVSVVWVVRTVITFSNFASIRNLESVDLFVGGFAETHVSGGQVIHDKNWNSSSLHLLS